MHFISFLVSHVIRLEMYHFFHTYKRSPLESNVIPKCLACETSVPLQIGILAAIKLRGGGGGGGNVRRRKVKGVSPRVPLFIYSRPFLHTQNAEKLDTQANGWFSQYSTTLSKVFSFLETCMWSNLSNYGALSSALLCQERTTTLAWK